VNRYRWFLPLLGVLCGMGLLLPCLVHAQQTAPPAGVVTARVSIRSLGKSTERKTVAATVLAVGNGGAVLKPDDPTAPNVTVYLATDTKFHRGATRSQNPGFTIGEQVTVRLAYFGDGAKARVFVAELWDTPLYEEQQKLRKEMFVGVVQQAIPDGVLSGYLIVRAEDETGSATYRVTENSVFYADDTRVPASFYKVGAEVTVKPRGLPSGGVMAGVVAESPTAVDIAYRDTLSVWKGVIEKLDPAAGLLYIKRSDGAKRTIVFPRNLTVTDEGAEKKAGPKRLYALAELTKMPVVVRLQRSEKPGANGLRTAVSISVANGSDATVPPDKTQEAREKERETSGPPSR
jgi:hypothetical protein